MSQPMMILRGDDTVQFSWSLFSMHDQRVEPTPETWRLPSYYLFNMQWLP